MAPVPDIPDCEEVYVTSASTPVGHGHNSTEPAVNQDDLSALLYIVVTLLFYSMGIVVGIISYIKRERADMEEEKVFDMYLALKRDPFNVHRQERVRQMARRLRKLERAKADRLEREQLASTSAQDGADDSSDPDAETHYPGVRGEGKKSKHVKISDCVPLVRTPNTKSSVRPDSEGDGEESMLLYPLVYSTTSMLVGSTTARVSSLLQMPPTSSTSSGSTGEPPPSAVSKGVEHERRGALPMGAKALIVRESGQSRDSRCSNTALLVSGPIITSEPTSAARIPAPNHASRDKKKSNLNT